MTFIPGFRRKRLHPRTLLALDGARSVLTPSYATTSIPIERAVPLIDLMAVSTDAAFKSGIFCFAISATCFSVTVPTLVLFGVPEPLATAAARFNRMAAGGVLVIKVNVRSV